MADLVQGVDRALGVLAGGQRLADVELCTPCLAPPLSSRPIAPGPRPITALNKYLSSGLTWIQPPPMQPAALRRPAAGGSGSGRGGVEDLAPDRVGVGDVRGVVNGAAAHRRDEGTLVVGQVGDRGLHDSRGSPRASGLRSWRGPSGMCEIDTNCALSRLLMSKHPHGVPEDVGALRTDGVEHDVAGFDEVRGDHAVEVLAHLDAVRVGAGRGLTAPGSPGRSPGPRSGGQRRRDLGERLRRSCRGGRWSRVSRRSRCRRPEDLAVRVEARSGDVGAAHVGAVGGAVLQRPVGVRDRAARGVLGGRFTPAQR